MLPFRRQTLASLLAALCLLAPARAQQPQQQPTPAQTQQTPTTPAPTPTPQQNEDEVVRISTDLVQTDVMVFDKSGKFVEGLKPEQFELKVDGRETPVVFFDRVRAGTVSEDAQLAAARGVKSASGGVVQPLDRGRIVVFFVDDLHLSAGSSQRMTKTLLRFIDDELGQNDVAAVVSASGQIGFLQQFTDDKVVLRAAASRINARPFSTRDGQSPPMTEAHAVAIERLDTSVLSYFTDAAMRETPGMTREIAETLVRNRARAMLVQSRNMSLNTLTSLESTVKGTAPLPGRKILFFISDGFMVEERGGEMLDRMRRVSDAAARAGVVIYSLDAEGLRTNMPDASTAAGFDPSGRLAQTDFGEISQLQAPLFTLAADTGGRAITNTNALGHAVAGALRETSLYYLLAWRPQAAAGGGAPKYRSVEVKVREQPDLKVAVRRGFFDAPPPEETARDADKKKKDDKNDKDDKNERAVVADVSKKPAALTELQAALRAQLPRGGLPTSLVVAYVSGPNGQGLLNSSVEVERAGLTFTEGEQAAASFDALGVVLDDQGKVVGGFQHEFDVTPAKEAGANQHLVFSSQTRVAPGLYQVRVATRDTRSGRVGSAMKWVEIPEFKRGKLTMSSIFLGERQSNVRPEALKPEELTKGVLMSVARRFSHASWIRLTTFIYNASAAAGSAPDVGLQIQIFRDNQPVFTAPVIKVATEGIPDPTRIPYAAELALNSFPAGRYVLQVTAIDRSSKASVSQRTSFVVE
jgi:VWFA-related protein